MVEVLYPVSFITSLTGLVLWHFYKDNDHNSRFLSKVFLGGFVLYLFSTISAEATMSEKMIVVFRDFMVMAVVAVVLGAVKKFKLLFFAGLGAFYMFFFSNYWKMYANTFVDDFEVSLLDEDGELLVELNAHSSIEKLNSLFAGHDITFERAFYPADEDNTDLDDYYVVDLPNGMSEKQMLKIRAMLASSVVVDHLEYNEKISIDPDFKNQFTAQDLDKETQAISDRFKTLINDPAVQKQWSFEVLDMEDLYKRLNKKNIVPKKKAKVAILDTGVDQNHEDLKDNFTSTRNKYNDDPVGHGTHCAGIAAAVTNNKKGIASFNLDSKLYEVTSIKVLNSFGGGTQRTITNGIIEAADKGADVISLSLGGRSNDRKQKLYDKVVKYANEKGAIVVVAAGNSAANSKNYSPANVDGVITVSAIDSMGKKAHFSNTVQNVTMGLAAPGTQIYATIPNNKYAKFNGTSMATPHVAGTIALMKAFHPDLDTGTAFDILDYTGLRTESGNKTGKIIQPGKALLYITQKD